MVLRHRDRIRDPVNLLMIAILRAAAGEVSSREDLADSLPWVVTLKDLGLMDEVFQEIMRILILTNAFTP